MNVSRLFKLLLALLVIGLTGGPTVTAQTDALQFMLEQARQKRALEQRRLRRATPATAQRPARVIVRDTPELPKVDPSTFIWVLGDAFAEQLAEGLDQAFAEQPDIAVSRRTKAEAGLARPDYFDWGKTVGDILASDQKITFVVIQMGANDRQAIREEPNLSREPDSDRWREIYSQRVDALIRAFGEKRIPVLWVGMPPMQSQRYSAEMLALNDIVRAQATKSGARFIDLWESFVDGENKFSAYGPDLNGQATKLRANDGVHFTAAGARKAAHFVELELKRLMEAQPPAAVIAIPAETTPLETLPLELQPGGVDRAIDRMVMGLPEPAGVPSLPMKPAAGAIFALNTPPVSVGGTLAGARDPRVASDAQAIIERIFGEGRVMDFKPGRVDDFRWPR